ncbi:VanW family protein [Peribacillus alkalitolerans]|uniref:VanW family protein n=1 Tax=Peribacillus alkalitolerans TaxID=1550385 RepID=UPI0013D0F40E|nr:VanW family protein [Peribacillus alkalitolerans]
MKRKWVITGVLAGSLIGLTGCNKDIEAEKALERKIERLEKKVEELEKKLEEQKTVDKVEEEEEVEEVMITVMDPNTGKVLKEIIPIEMGYGQNKESYEKQIADWVRSLARSSYDQRMVLDKIGANGEIIKGKPRVILSENQLVESIMGLSDKGGEVNLPLSITESGYKAEEAKSLGEVVVGTYTTKFDSSVTGRVRNIELSSQTIDNVILGVGDIFSFNTQVGERTAARGYQKAKEIVDKELVEGIGGGICQTSSTLYNAIDQLQIDYVEHHNHSLDVGYVPKGRDATVSWGGPDFRFKNIQSVPLLIKASVNKQAGTLTVEIRTSKVNAKLIKK